MKGRDLKIIQQTLIGLSFRIVAVVGTFIAMPVMLKRLGDAELGIWLVLLSVFQWITVFDLGVAAGARNEMARAFACHDNLRIRQAIATGLIYTVWISAALGIGCIGIGAFTPLIPFLERVSFHGHTTGWAIWIVALGSCAAFALNFIQMIYAADQKTSAISYFSAASSLVFLGLVYWWPLSRLGNLNQISGLYLISIIAANLSLVLWYFWKRREIIPKVRDFDPEIRGRILGFGIRIFIIQIAAMVVFTTARILVSSFLKPSDVVVYDAAFKLFSVITMLHGLIMSAFWSSFTEAHAHGDWTWMCGRIKLLQMSCIPILLACLGLALASPWIIRHWMTEQQVGPMSLYVSFALLTALSSWSNVFAFFLNGIGDTKLQLSTSLIALAVHFPSCYLLAKIFGLEMTGINLGTMVSVAFFAFSGPIYVWRLLKAGSESLKSDSLCGEVATTQAST
jgi:O-antigen/teichoic acid export membrane protein